MHRQSEYMEEKSENEEETSSDLKIQILRRHFKADGTSTRMMLLSTMRRDYDEKAFEKAITMLETQSLIKIYGDKSYINAKGLAYLKEHRNE